MFGFVDKVSTIFIFKIKILKPPASTISALDLLFIWIHALSFKSSILLLYSSKYLWDICNLDFSWLTSLWLWVSSIVFKTYTPLLFKWPFSLTLQSILVIGRGLRTTLLWLGWYLMPCAYLIITYFALSFAFLFVRCVLTSKPSYLIYPL